MRFISHFPHVLLLSHRGSRWGGGTNHRGCTPMTTPTATRPAPAQNARTAPGTEASPTTCARRRMWRRSWTTVPAPTGRRGRRACWACRISSRAKEYWGGIPLKTCQSGCELWCSMFSLLKALCELLNSKRRCYYIIALSDRTYNKSL